ncbi:MAG: hypothetical protein AAB370_11770 [Verrucomicrobiota bacterium]|mgnify:FL=1
MSASQNRLAGLTNDLRAEWEQTKHYWNDAKSQEFEQRFMSELIPAVNQTISTIESLELVLTKLRNDCE